MNGRQSSLRMIQNLDRGSASLERQLDQIDQILHHGVSGPDCNARAHWTLRWILKKMQAEGKSGAEYVPLNNCMPHVFLLTEPNSCYTSLKAWNLLLQIVTKLPPNVTIPTLTSLDFASSLASALAHQHSIATEPVSSSLFSSKAMTINQGLRVPHTSARLMQKPLRPAKSGESLSLTMLVLKCRAVLPVTCSLLFPLV